MLLDITPLDERGAKLFTLYDKDLTEGVNLLIGNNTLQLISLHFHSLHFSIEINGKVTTLCHLKIAWEVGAFTTYSDEMVKICIL